jgi:hypothetical protein
MNRPVTHQGLVFFLAYHNTSPVLPTNSRKPFIEEIVNADTVKVDLATTVPAVFATE